MKKETGLSSIYKPTASGFWSLFFRSKWKELL